LSNSPTEREGFKDSFVSKTASKLDRTNKSALEKYIDTKMNSVYKKRISNSKRYLDNSTNLDAKLIFRDDQRHVGDLDSKLMGTALNEKRKGDAMAVG